MTITFNQTLRQALLNQITTSYGSASQIAIFSGTAPTDADTALSSNPICARLPFSASAFGSASAAKPSILTAASITQENAWATVTATFYRTYAQSTAGITTSGFVSGNVYQVQSTGTSTNANFVTLGYTGTAVSVGDMLAATGTTLTGNGTCYLMSTMEQGTVGAGSGDLNLNTTSIVAGGPVSISSFTRQM
jgi:hypothetical protein